MPRRILPLTDIQVRKAKPQSKPITLFDGDGLYILVVPTGGKLWRFKYRFDGKDRLLALGSYPEVSLAMARERRLEVRRQLAEGIDPGAARKAQRGAEAGADTFGAIAEEWYARFSPMWKPSYAKVLRGRLDRDILPWIGKRPVKEITAPELLAVLRRVESRGALESAHRIRTHAGQVLRYAVATGKAERDPSGDLRGALPQPGEKHFAAITDPKEVAKLLRAIDDYHGHFVTKCALRLAPLVFVRPGELRHAEWSEIDLDAAQWNIPGDKMKGGLPHLVPLSTQAVSILEELKPLTGEGKYVFPSLGSGVRAMSENTVLAALRRLGYTKEQMTPHGFRAMARTILDEVLQAKPELIEHQLAHQVRDPLGRAYNRTSHLEERRTMMQRWADYLDGIRQGATIIPMKRRA